MAVLVGVQVSSPLFMSLGRLRDQIKILTYTNQTKVEIVLTSPGALLTMPISILADKFVSDYLLPWPAMVGIAFVVIGFLGINLSEEIPFFKNTRFRAKWHRRRWVVGGHYEMEDEQESETS